MKRLVPAVSLRASYLMVKVGLIAKSHTYLFRIGTGPGERKVGVAVVCGRYACEMRMSEQLVRGHPNILASIGLTKMETIGRWVFYL